MSPKPWTDAADDRTLTKAGDTIGTFAYHSGSYIDGTSHSNAERP